MKIRISSRKSELAQHQAYQVGEALKKVHPQVEIEYLFRESLGDINLHDPLWKMPEKGVFTEDFYQDLVQEKTDLVVHSWKDLPTEEKAETFIAATLPRADQRDILLFKKKSQGKKKLKIFSSSPRRIYNLKEFLKWALPVGVEDIAFESVRGNIATRVHKWAVDSEIDGLVLAKAALDRLLDGEKFLETKKFLQEILHAELWMVLPLSENPNAAAQGALAIEVKRNRKDILELLAHINCPETFQTANREREILKSFGGGCHLALGMSCLKRNYGDLEIVKGLTPDGQSLDIKKFKPTKKLRDIISREKLDFKTVREQLKPINLSDLNALYVAKSEAWNFSEKFEGLVWASGIETWKKLAQLGVWVSGSNESLGESEKTRVEHFFKYQLKWGRLSHAAASPLGDKTPVASYKLELSVLSTNINFAAAYIWTSPHEFDLAVKKFPELLQQFHICGPGRTYEALLQRLGHDKKLFVELVNYNMENE